MRYLLTGLLLSILFIGGCTPIISEQSMKLVNSDASFKAVKETPTDFIGKHLLLGGRIANVRNSSDGAQIEIVQFDITSSGYPENTFRSYGRFLATSSSFLDPLIFKRGMLITLVGEVKGKITRKLDDMDYTYPLILMREWYLWQGSEPGSDRLYPAQLPQYDPSSYGYGYEPHLQRPYNPIFLPR